MIPLIFLPGSLCNYRLFSKQLEQFSMASVVDYGNVSSIESMALSVLKRTPPRFALAGLSMGGIVAQEIMRVAPQRVERLALLNTNYRKELPERIIKREEEILAIKQRQLNINMMLQIRYYPYYFTVDRVQKNFELDTIVTMAYEFGQSGLYNQWLALNKRRDYSETLRKIECPTLVLTGDQDSICTPKRHNEMYQLLEHNSRCQLEIIPDCAHLSTLEAPRTVNKILHKWLNDE